LRENGGQLEINFENMGGEFLRTRRPEYCFVIIDGNMEIVIIMRRRGIQELIS
jgi:hypothetical protein